jgi:hypothetical protein
LLFNGSLLFIENANLIFIFCNEGISAAKNLLDVAEVERSLLNIIRNLDVSDPPPCITIHSENGQLLFVNATDKALNTHKVHLATY